MLLWFIESEHPSLYFVIVMAVAGVNGIVPEKTPTIGMINEHPQSDPKFKS